MKTPTIPSDLPELEHCVPWCAPSCDGDDHDRMGERNPEGVQCRFPRRTQIVGVRKLLEHSYFFITDDMGVGKSMQANLAAQIMFMRGTIRRVIVVAPAPVKSVWFDRETGEVSLYTFRVNPICVSEVHTDTRQWGRGCAPGHRNLCWYVTNYEWVRLGTNYEALASMTGSDTLLILDESSAVKNHAAKQTKAVKQLRRRCGRVVLLNGTPIANSPGDLYAQSDLMHPSILGFSNWWQFRARYAILGGFQQKQIVGWRGLDELNKKMAPYVLRRETSDCMDMPEKLPPVTVTVPLSKRAWKLYKELREELVADMDSGKIAIARQAGVKAMRLSQITSGFIGGLEDLDGNRYEDAESYEVVGSEKLDWIVQFAKMRLEQEPNFKMVVWTRFQLEAERVAEEVGKLFVHCELLYGRNDREERTRALRLLHPQSAPRESGLLAGTVYTGALGINAAAANVTVYPSNSDSLKDRNQSEKRTHRPPQARPCMYYDVVATGPEGQKTIDHHRVAALHRKNDVAKWTVSEWRRALLSE